MPGDDALQRWRIDLGTWAIPEAIRQSVRESPWVMPRESFTNRARRIIAAPSGVSYERAREALAPGGTVLDVGCGAGAASLPLVPYARGITGVDSSPDMLEAFRSVAGSLDGGFRTNERCHTVLGQWPDVAGETPAAEVVVCHHVLYNVADLAPFVEELTLHARRRVVVELTARHPMSDLNPLWERVHRVQRPLRPTAEDALDALRSLHLPVRAISWSTPASVDFGDYQKLLDITGRRLCLPPERLPELDIALRAMGVDPQRPALSNRRDLMTIWWPGTAD